MKTLLFILLVAIAMICFVSVLSCCVLSGRISAEEEVEEWEDENT